MFKRKLKVVGITFAKTRPASIKTKILYTSEEAIPSLSLYHRNSEQLTLSFEDPEYSSYLTCIFNISGHPAQPKFIKLLFMCEFVNHIT
jgi:hypothetical protein